MRLGDLIAPRRMRRDFRWLLASSWTSNVGDGVALAAAPLLIASMTSSPVLVASGAVLQFLPWLLFGLHAGAVADRFDRRRLVMVANAARMIVLAALCAFLFAAGSAWPFLLEVVCIALAIVLVSRMARTPVPPRSPLEHAAPTHPPVHTDIAHGVRWLWRHPPVRMLVIIVLAFNITWAAPWGILVLYATEHLQMGPVGYGALTTASAAGGIVATLCFGWLERRVSFATLMRVCLSLEVLMHLAFALTTAGWAALTIMVGFGAYSFVWGTISTTVRQRLVPTELQGRVGSVNMVGVFGGMVIGQALGGVIAQTWGLTAPWWFAFVGAAITLVLVWRPISHVVSSPPVAAVRTRDRPEAEPEPGTEAVG